VQQELERRMLSEPIVPLVTSQRPTPAFKGCAIGCAAMISILMGIFIWCLSLSPTRERDDVDLLISKYGPPDSQDSTDHDVPRPLFPTRLLVYEAEHVRAVYLPGFGARVLDP